MGIVNSKKKNYVDTSAFGYVYLHTDKKAYFGGEIVTGQIHLDIYTQFPGTDLYLRFKGKEEGHVVVTVTRGSGDHERSEDELRSEKLLIYNNNIRVHSFDRKLEAGQYTIPFTFLLPTHLPCTFYQEGPRYLGRIAYCLEAYVPSDSQPNVMMRSKQELILREPPMNPMMKVEGFSQEKKSQLKNWLCCSGGESLLRVRFEKNCYFFGEKAQVLLQLDNTNSKLDILGIKFALVQKVTVRAKGNSGGGNVDKIKRSISGIRAYQDSGFRTISMDLHSSQSYNYKSAKARGLLSHLTSITSHTGSMNAQTNSRLVTSHFTLAVTSYVGEYLSTAPAIEVPVHLTFPELENPSIEPPKIWNPQKVDTKNLVFAPHISQANNLAINYQGGGMNMNNNQMGKEYAKGQTVGGDTKGNYQPPMQYGQGMNNQQQYGANYYSK